MPGVKRAQKEKKRRVKRKLTEQWTENELMDRKWRSSDVCKLMYLPEQIDMLKDH